MKKKINAKMMQMVALTLLLTVCALLVIGYHLLQEQVIDDLKSYADILGNRDTTQLEEKDASTLKSDKIRITLVNADGSVIYDNMTDYRKMENHKNRPEIAQAMKTGEGQTVRISSTFSHNTYYYAIRLTDGSVLRVSKEAGNVWQILLRSLPLLVVVCAFLLVICAPISRLLTRKLVEPIEQMAQDMDHMDTIPVYEELEPFVKTIHAQHQDIMKNANMRQEFTANVSHELKTPLTSISGYAELIENGMASGDDTVRFAKEIHKSANRLLTLINDIIRLSQLDSTPETTFEKVDLYEVAQITVDMLAMSAQQHRVSLQLEGRKCYVYGNKQMLEDLIYNLCDNAIRYNVENGLVCVTVGEEDDNVFLAVRDTGIGISKENQERVFERFYRVDKSRSKQTGGTGLGLAIVKHIVAEHHAKLDIKSKEGKGTEIKVTFV